VNLSELIKVGIKRELTRNKPLEIKDENKAWIVTSGIVDIFAVKLKEGEPSGERYHVCRIKEGEAFFGIKAQQIVFIALGGVNTVCYETNIKDFFNKLDASKVSNLVDKWIIKLEKSLVHTLTPKGTDKINEKFNYELNKDKSITVKNNPLWIRIKKGKIDLFNFITVNNELLIFPITKDTWVTGIEDSIIDAISTSTLLLKGNFNDIFINFNKYIVEIIQKNIQKINFQEVQRLKTKILNKHKIFEISLTTIRNVLLPKKKQRITDIDISNPLLAVTKIVGDYLKIDIKPHPQDNSHLENILRASGVKARKVILKDEWWKNDSGPLLCFYKKNKTPVAILPKSPTSYELIDIINKKNIKVDEKISQELEPFGYTFYRPFPQKKLTAKDLLKFGIYNIKKEIFIIFLIGICGSLLGLLTPIFTGIIFDTIIPEAALGQLFQIAFILISCALATLFFEITRATALLRVEGKADYSLQAAIWDRLINLPVPFFRNYSAGELARRSMGIDAIRQIMSGVTVQAILSSIFSLFYWGLLFYYNVGLAIIGTLLGLILVVTTFLIGYIGIRYHQEINSLNNKISGMIYQFLSGIPKLRITGTEVNAFYIWSKLFAQQRRLNKKLTFTQNIMKTFNSVFPLLSMICIFSWVIFKVGNGLTTGQFLAFNSAYTSFQNALLQMSMALVMSLNIIPLYNNLKPIVQTLPEIVETKEHPGDLSGDIEVSHVFFKYNPEGPYILKDISLKIDPGEFVAIVGESGSGKSTLFRILLGFERPEKGKIFYDGKDLEMLDVLELRKQLGVVLQNAKLLQGTIFDNIVGSGNYTINDAWEAAKMAGCYEDIQNMPMKMHTMVPAGGGNLSGGQRQRIIIARALIKKPRIIFFDEATSALDNKTQAIVTESLENMKITRVVIAHRISTIINADRIYCLDKGVIVESGTYEELMANKGFFYKLAKRQIA